MPRTHFLPFSVLLAIAFPAVAQQTQTIPSFTISTVAGTGVVGSTGDGGPATAAELDNPVGVTLDAAGNIYIADMQGHRIRRVNQAGIITTFAGTGVQGFSGDGGPATSAQLNLPVRMSVDAAGSLYIADSGNNRIRKVTNGIITTIAGNGTAGFGGDNGAALSASLHDPTDVALDKAGNLYIVDTLNLRIRKVTNGVMSTVAGTGVESYGGDGGPATSASFAYPVAMTIDGTGSLFVADRDANRIRKISGDVITTVAGNGTAGFSGDGGPAISASLNQPAGVAFDAAGNLYIPDFANNRIRMLATTGILYTVAGNGMVGFSGDGGPAISADLTSPRTAAIAASGDIYFSDLANGRIRLLTPISQAPAITSAGVASAGAFGGFPSIAPGSWIEIYGSNLASDTRSWATADFNGVNAPTALGGTTVTIGGKPAFIDYISPGQVNALVTSDTPIGPQPLTVTTSLGASAPITVTVNATQPGLLAPASFTINGTSYAAALFSDGTYVLPVGAIPGVTSRPAKPGDTIVLYGVGFGPVSPSIPAGQLVQQSNMLASSFQMLVGGTPATVAYAGLAPSFTGLYQFDITVPSIAAGAQLLTFTLGANPGAQKLNIAIGN